MKIKRIYLSQKRGGNGYISSFSVSIGKNEAQSCGFIQDDRPLLMCKSIEDENGQIIIKPKRISISKDLIEKAIQLADNWYSESLQSGVTIWNAKEIWGDFMVRHKCETVNLPAEQALLDFLLGLSIEEISDLATLMNIGRNYDANINLPSVDRFIDYWEYISPLIPDSFEELVEYLMEKLPLAEYLRKGVLFVKLPVGVDPLNMSMEEIDELK